MLLSCKHQRVAVCGEFLVDCCILISFPLALYYFDVFWICVFFSETWLYQFWEQLKSNTDVLYHSWYFCLETYPVLRGLSRFIWWYNVKICNDSVDWEDDCYRGIGKDVKGSGHGLFYDALSGERETIESLRTIGLRLRIEPKVCVFLHTAFTCYISNAVTFLMLCFPLIMPPHSAYGTGNLTVSCTIQSYKCDCLKICNLLRLCCI
jgi:hypothetical protein